MKLPDNKDVAFTIIYDANYWIIENNSPYLGQ